MTAVSQGAGCCIYHVLPWQHHRTPQGWCRLHGTGDGGSGRTVSYRRQATQKAIFSGNEASCRDRFFFPVEKTLLLVSEVCFTASS